jgi:hypothetical protein
MKRNSEVYKYKNLAIFACLAAAIYIIYIFFTIINPTTINKEIEGLAVETPKSVADADPDLKCPAPSSGADPTKCTTVDLMKMAYDLAADPRLSVMELDTISKVCKSRKFDGYNKFAMDAMMLRAATMYNTAANEKEFNETLENMTKNKQECYSNDFMKSIKGLLVGSKDEPTLSVAQSEAVRCYAHRLNAFRKCLNACK